MIQNTVFSAEVQKLITQDSNVKVEEKKKRRKPLN